MVAALFCRTQGSSCILRCCWLQVEREIRLHSCLQHDSIISLYAAFEDDQHVYLAQEFASGQADTPGCLVEAVKEWLVQVLASGQPLHRATAAAG